MRIDEHIFQSPLAQSIIEQGVTFFNSTRPMELPPRCNFPGCGVYGLYYTGDFELYAPIAQKNNKTMSQLIYIGKAVPKGWRTGRVKRNDASPVLMGRLKEHTRSIKQVSNLDVSDFKCRFMILNGIEIDLIVPMEAELIRRFQPLWNSGIDGFGNHDPGKGRYNQAISEWDALHPGRMWCARLMGATPTISAVQTKVINHLAAFL